MHAGREISTSNGVDFRYARRRSTVALVKQYKSRANSSCVKLSQTVGHIRRCLMFDSGQLHDKTRLHTGMDRTSRTRKGRALDFLARALDCAEELITARVREELLKGLDARGSFVRN